MFIFRSPCVLFHRQSIVNNFACCERLHVGRWHLQKKKWTWDKISSLIAWNYETSAILGPCIDTKKAKSTALRVKHKVVHDVVSDNCDINTSQAAVNRDELTDGETRLADLPCSVSRRLSSQTVLEDPVEKLQSSAVTGSLNSQKTVPTGKRQNSVGSNSSLSKQMSDDSFFDSTKRKGTYAYTWVNSYSQSSSAITDGKEEKTLPLFAQNTQNVLADNMVENVGHHTSSALSDAVKMLHSDREQSTDNSSATELQAEEDEAQKNSSNQYILTFPLFASPELSSEAANVSARLPSVSAILKATMPPESQEALNRWEQRMIAQLGEDGFKEYQTGC